MSINVQKLKGVIVEKGTTQENVAQAIGVDRSTFYRKMKNGGENFSVKEMQLIIKFVPLSEVEAASIFFKF